MVEARGDQHAFGSVARPGAISRWLRRSYTRLGPRYPRIALLVTLFGSYLTGALATAGTALYIDMSLAEFARLSLASWFLIWTPEVVVAGAIGLTRIKPVSRWLEGTRDEWHTAKGWEAAADLPPALTRSPIVYAAALPGMVLWGLYAVDQLDLPEYSVGIFFAASLLVYLYWAAVRFLALEFNFRPILDDIARTLPTDPHFQPLRVPLRWRLLASLVAVILITGIAVGGFAARGAQDVRGLGFALLGSAVVAVVVSSWLIGLLSTSITRPISRLRDAAREVGRGDLSIRVPVASTDESGELTRAFNQMVDGLEQRERLREAFGTYVDPDLTERVLEEGPDLAGDEVELSLLFMDIRVVYDLLGERRAARGGRSAQRSLRPGRPGNPAAWRTGQQVHRGRPARRVRRAEPS
jgi:adenylate cyclase